MSDTPNQEDLSVEDILSSIKDILVEKEEKTDTDTATTPDDDVLNLDDSMIVNDSANTQNIENLLSEITEPVVDEAQKEDNKTPSLADEIDINKTLEMADQIDLEELTTLETPSDETKEEADNTSAVKEDTIDASANIINNFAKVFAEKQYTQQSTSQPSAISSEITENIEKLGISDMVQDAIVKQTKINMDSHFEQIASKIIAEQTQQWLNANLANIVEKTVAKEIERVIAKVGS